MSEGVFVWVDSAVYKVIAIKQDDLKDVLRWPMWHTIPFNSTVPGGVRNVFYF